MQIIGPLKYSELPKKYHQIFESGQFDSIKGDYRECNPPSSAMITAVFFSIIYLLPSVFILISGIHLFLEKPKLISQIVEDLSSGFGFLIIGIILFSIIVWGLYLMLKMAWHSWLRVGHWMQVNNRKNNDKSGFGFLLDEHNLVFRHSEYFDEYTCAFLPKTSIISHKSDKIRFWFPKQSYNINVVKIQYKDEQQQIRELIIKERFSMTASNMNQLIQQWVNA